MGDKSNSNSNSNQNKQQCQPVPGIRPLLRQAPLNIENLPSRVKGSNLKVLPPKFCSDSPVPMNNGAGNCGPNRAGGGGGFPRGQPNCCMPPTGCFMPPPMCSPYPQPMCTPCPYPPQMCCPPPCPPMFCCPQPQPVYSPYPHMPPPNCCPPPPCPPPPCCKPEPRKPPAANHCNTLKESQCCGAAKTLVCLPKGQRPGQTNGPAYGPGHSGGMPSMEQPASYNNCNFYVSELPKGMKGKNLMGKSTATVDECLEENYVDEACETNPYDPYTMKNLPAGDGKVFPPPNQYRTWGNDDEQVSGGRYSQNHGTNTDRDGNCSGGGGGRKGFTTNVYIGNEDEDESRGGAWGGGGGQRRNSRNAPTRNGRNSNGGATGARKPLTRRGGNNTGYGNRNATATTTTGNRATAGRTTATSTKRNSNNRGSGGGGTGKYLVDDAYNDYDYDEYDRYNSKGGRNSGGGGGTGRMFGSGGTYQTYAAQTTPNGYNTADIFGNHTAGGRTTGTGRNSVGTTGVRRNLGSGGYTSDGYGGKVVRKSGGSGGRNSLGLGGRNATNVPGRNSYDEPRERRNSPGPGVRNNSLDKSGGRRNSPGPGARNNSLGNSGGRRNSPGPSPGVRNNSFDKSRGRSPGPGGRNNSFGERGNSLGKGGRNNTNIQSGRSNSPGGAIKNQGYKKGPQNRPLAIERVGMDVNINEDEDDDGRGRDGRGTRTKGGHVGGHPRGNPSVEYCIAQDHHQECTPVTWKRKHPCCMPLKSRKLKTLCQKCHQRYAPTGTANDEHCGLPMPSPRSVERSLALIQQPAKHQQEVQVKREHFPLRNTPGCLVNHAAKPAGRPFTTTAAGVQTHNVNLKLNTIQKTTTGVQANRVNVKIGAGNATNHQHQTFITGQALTAVTPKTNHEKVDFKVDPVNHGQRHSPWAPPNRRKTPFHPRTNDANERKFTDESDEDTGSDSGESDSSGSEEERHNHSDNDYGGCEVPQHSKGHDQGHMHSKGQNQGHGYQNQGHKAHQPVVGKQAKSMGTMIKAGQRIQIAGPGYPARQANSEGSLLITKDVGVGASCKFDSKPARPHEKGTVVPNPRLGPHKNQHGMNHENDSIVHLLNAHKLDGSGSYEVSNPLIQQVRNTHKGKGQRNYIANIVSVPQFKLPPELFQKYQPFPATRSRSTNHVHEMRKTALRNIPPGPGNNEIIANYMTIAANADPRLNVQFQTGQFGRNPNCPEATSQNPNPTVQITTNYQELPLFQPVLFSNPNPPCATGSVSEILPSHSEIQRIIIRKDPNKHTQDVQVLKRHVPHQVVMGHHQDPCTTSQPVYIPLTQTTPPCPVFEQIPQCSFTLPQCPVPKPQCPVPQCPVPLCIPKPQCPLPQCPVPQCPVPQCIPKPQCPVPKPHCRPKPHCPVPQCVPKPPCPVPKPKCHLSFQPQCPLNIPPQCPLRIEPQCPITIDSSCDEPKPQTSTLIEAVVRTNRTGSTVHVGVNQSNHQAQSSNHHSHRECQPPAQQSTSTIHNLKITSDANPIETVISTAFSSKSFSLLPQTTKTTNHLTMVAAGKCDAFRQANFASKIKISNSTHGHHRHCAMPPPPNSCAPAQTSYVLYNTTSKTKCLPGGSHKQRESDWDSPDSVAKTIRSIYGDPIRTPNNCYNDPIPIPNGSVTISSYEDPNFGIHTHRAEAEEYRTDNNRSCRTDNHDFEFDEYEAHRTRNKYSPGNGMGRDPGYVHHTPTDPRFPMSKEPFPTSRSIPKLSNNGYLSQTEIRHTQFENRQQVNNMTQRTFQHQGHPQNSQRPQHPQHTEQTTQTRMMIIERPNQPSEVRIIKTPVKVPVGYYNGTDRDDEGYDRGRNGRSRGRSGGGYGRDRSRSPGNTNEGFKNGGGWYQDSEPVNQEGKNSCGVNPCPTKGPCYPLRPCKSPRLITCKGQKPIFSAFPPACPIRETLASILAKKPPANCKWHDKDIPPFYDYCMPSIKYHDPLHQRIKYVDHCGGRDSEPQNQQQEEQPSRRRRSSSIKKKRGRGIKRRLN